KSVTEVIWEEGNWSTEGIEMSGTTILVWLVLVVLALKVFAFVTRVAEKCRLANRFSKSPERTISALRNSEPVILKHQQTQPTRREGLPALSVRYWSILRSVSCGSERIGE